MAVFPQLFSPQFPSQPVPGGTTVATTEFPKELAPFIKDILEKAQAQQKGAQYQAYTGPQIAPFTTQEEAAMKGMIDQTTGLAGTDVAKAAPYFTGAKTAIEGLGDEFTGDVAQQYMNPYQQAVTDQAKAKATEEYEQQKQVLAANAIRNQPFGGSRQAITEGMAQGDYLDRLTDIQERGLAGAYTQGRAAFEAQKAREANMANQLMGMGATIPQQALRDLGIQQQVGEAERMQNQMALDLKQKQFMEEREFPTRALQEYAATVRGIPFQPSTYQTQTAYQSTPSVGQQLLQLGMGGLGAWTQFSGQPLGQTLGMTGKATGGLVGLPMVSNQTGNNEQMRFLGADRDLSIYDQMRDPEMERILVEEAQARKDAEIAEEIAREAFDIEYGIERENRKGKLDRFMDMIYTPQRLLKKFRAEGGLAGLPVVYRDIGTPPVETTDRKNRGFFKMLEDAGVLTYPGIGPSPIPINVSEEEMPEYLEQGFNVGKEGLPTPEYYKMLEESEYDRGTEALANLPPLDQSNINMEDAFAMDPDRGVPPDPYSWESPPSNVSEKPVINFEDLDQDDLGKFDLINIGEEGRTELKNLGNFNEVYGKSVAPKDVALYQQALQKHLEEGGSLDTYLATLDSMLTPEYKERKIKDIETQRALGQGLALMKAAGAAGDPNKSFIQNLVASGKAYAEDVGPSETAARTALAELEELPLVVGEKRYTTEKDVLELTKPASAEQLSSEELQLKGKMFDKEGYLKLLELDTTLEENSKERKLRKEQINILANLEKDKGLLNLFSIEMDYLKNKETIQGALAKTKTSLIDKGILNPNEVKYGESKLQDLLFGIGTFTFNENNDIVSMNGEPIGDIRIQKIYDKYRSLIAAQMGKWRMKYILNDPDSYNDEGDLQDYTMASINIILDAAKKEFDALGIQIHKK